MGEKDMTEKTLEACNDVFADIVNVLLFNGEQRVREDELEAADPQSRYKADGKVHEQERDVSKYWKKTNVCIAMIGYENQTRIEKVMPLRVIGYDGAAYRAQILEEKPHPLYPVVTLVLYFGKRHWKKPRSLFECLEIPDELKPYVNDYRINVFEISFLTREQVNMFRSDFRIVADYFVQTRVNKEYHPDPTTVKHVHETLQLMSVLTHDRRYEETLTYFRKGEDVNMCAVLDRLINQGKAEGIAEGKAVGKAEGKMWTLFDLVKDGILSVSTAASKCEMTEEAFLAEMKKAGFSLA